MDRFRLYELCVQDVGALVPILVAIHRDDAGGQGGDGDESIVLGEDFCGSAALSAAWVAAGPDRRAIAVDHDPEVLRHAPRTDGIELVEGDVIEATDPERHAVDVLHVGNFSIGEWHTRAALIDYLRHARRRLRSGGVFVCDTYGGANAFELGVAEREHELEDDRTVLYEWEQREVDPFTGLVENAIHFQVRRGGVVERELRDAFVYRWRIWSVPELRDALEDAGFTRVEVHAKVPAAMDGEGNAYLQALDGGDLGAELDESFDVLVAAW